MLSLSNKVSLVTGASSGIGRATAILFSKLDSSLTIVGRDEKALDETIESCKDKKKIVKIVGDLTDINICKKAVDESIKIFGKLNSLINCAAIFKLNNIENTKIEDFDHVMNVNLRSVFLLTQMCVPYLKASKGSIVNVSSIAGTRTFPNLLAYSLSKAALDQFTKCLSLELAAEQVSPGTIITNIHRRAGYSEEEYKNFLEHCRKIHALGRPGEPSEVANAIAFLSSDCSSFITGELMHVDGGRHRMSPR